MAAEFSIQFERDQNGHLFAHVDGIDLTSGWQSTPEAALVALCEALRKRRSELAARPVGMLRDNGLIDAYVWLERIFS